MPTDGRLAPGIIEAHAHIGIGEQGVGFEGADTNEQTSPITPWCNALEGIGMRDSAFDDFRRASTTSVQCATLVVPTSSVVRLWRSNAKAISLMTLSSKTQPNEMCPRKIRKALMVAGGNAGYTHEVVLPFPATLLKAKQYLSKLEAATTEQENLN